jgi:hypothetical protein
MAIEASWTVPSLAPMSRRVCHNERDRGHRLLHIDLGAPAGNSKAESNEGTLLSRSEKRRQEEMKP